MENLFLIVESLIFNMYIMGYYSVKSSFGNIQGVIYLSGQPK